MEMNKNVPNFPTYRGSTVYNLNNVYTDNVYSRKTREINRQKHGMNRHHPGYIYTTHMGSFWVFFVVHKILILLTGQSVADPIGGIGGNDSPFVAKPYFVMYSSVLRVNFVPDLSHTATSR